MIALDHALRAWVVAHRIGVLDGPMWFLSAVGRGGIVWAAIAAVVAVARRRRRDFVLVPLSLLLASGVADYVIKPAVDRQRPFVDTPSIHVIGGRPDDASFPSGHAANAFASALVLSAIVPAGRIAWWALAIAIGYSRIYLGVHYPLDVLGGAAVGLACAAIVLEITKRRAG